MLKFGVSLSILIATLASLYYVWNTNKTKHDFESLQNPSRYLVSHNIQKKKLSQDEEQLLKDSILAANNGDPKGYHNLGMFDLFYHKDTASALENFEKASLNNNLGMSHIALNNKGAILRFANHSFINIPGIDKNIKKSIAVLEDASDRNVHNAQNTLAITHSSNKNKHEESLQYFTDAAVGGSQYAQYNLGIVYRFGLLNQQQDDIKSFQYFLEAANNGLHYAQQNVAIMYQKGIGTKADKIKAKEWYEKAVESSNNSLSKFNLGLLVSEDKSSDDDIRYAGKLIRESYIDQE